MLCEEKEFHWERFYLLQSNLEILIETTKQQYCSKIANKLSDLSISSRIYWSILKCFLTGKHVLYIPPIFHEIKFDYNILHMNPY